MLFRLLYPPSDVGPSSSKEPAARAHLAAAAALLPLDLLLAQQAAHRGLLGRLLGRQALQQSLHLAQVYVERD